MLSWLCLLIPNNLSKSVDVILCLNLGGVEEARSKNFKVDWKNLLSVTFYCQLSHIATV